MSAEPADPRTYVVGLPVVVTVGENGWVTVEVDTSELAEGMHEENSNVGPASDEQVAADSATVREWLNLHMVKNEGYTP